MKLTALCFLISLFGLHASNSYSQKTVTLQLENVQMFHLLDLIENQTEYHFVYKIKDVDLTRALQITAQEEKVPSVLDKIFKGTETGYKIYGNQIFLTRKPTSLFSTIISVKIQETITVTGTITETKTGMSVPAANILEKGTSNGVMSDFDGNFSIEVPEDAILRVSYIGYATKEINVNGRNEINIVLETDAAALDEVVVVGYGTQKKVNLTGSVSTIDFDDELENRPITNASQALGGTASGVWVSQNSGKPGSDGAQIRVRGWGTMNNSNPLVIIDGVEGSFNQLNPSDIESISVLKDAASAAIYGSKAANGVVLITTKMGTENGEMRVKINSYAGLQSLGRRYDLITNSSEHMELHNLALKNVGGSPLFSEQLISDFRNGSDPYKYPNTDWFEEVFQTAMIQEHNLSVNGGSEKTSSFLSFNYLDQDGMVSNNNSQRYGLRANVDSNVNDWLKLTARVNYIRRDSKEPYADVSYGSLGRVFEGLQGATPYMAPYTRDGRFGSVQAIDEEGNILSDNRNPLIETANGRTKTEEDVLTINASANIELTDDLSIDGTFSTNRNWTIADRYNTSVFGYTDTGLETTTRNFNREGIEINRSQISTMQNIFFSTLNYNRIFAKIHDVSAIAGIQYETNKIQNVYARRSNPPKEGLTQVDAGTSGIQGEGNMVGVKMLSYFGRINYSLFDKFLFEANFRADGSSRFSENKRWGYFPGFSAGWRLSEEKFIQDLDIFSNLKLRGSWGQLGNQNVSGYWPYLTIINQANNLSYSYNDSFAPGAAVTSLVDEDITWETSSSLDLGIEMGFLNNRLGIEADYFRKKTEDMLVQLPIPLLMGGITPPFENLGEMTNNGFEIVVNYSNSEYERDRLQFNVGANLTYIENEVTKFRGGDSPDQLYLIREGYSYRTLYGYNVTGIYQSDVEASEHMHSNGFTPKAGNLKFEDINNDGRLGFEDKQALGNTIPKYTFGLSPSFEYQGFDLNILLQGIAGVSAYTQNSFTNSSSINMAISTKWRDAWTPQNSDTDIPMFRLDNSWDNSPSSFWVQEISFIKLKNIQLGYTFSDRINSRLGVDKLYLYANGQNLYTLVNEDYEGYDPERSTFNSGNNIYPIPRIISLGLNLNI